MQDAVVMFPALAELTYREGGSSFPLFLSLSGNFPQELEFIPPKHAECRLLYIFERKDLFFSFFLLFLFP